MQSLYARCTYVLLSARGLSSVATPWLSQPSVKLKRMKWLKINYEFVIVPLNFPNLPSNKLECSNEILRVMEDAKELLLKLTSHIQSADSTMSLFNELVSGWLWLLATAMSIVFVTFLIRLQKQLRSSAVTKSEERSKSAGQLNPNNRTHTKDPGCDHVDSTLNKDPLLASELSKYYTRTLAGTYDPRLWKPKANTYPTLYCP